MLTLAASNWDIRTHVMDPNPNCPSATTCSVFTVGDYTSFEDVYEFGKDLDLVTLEIENVNADALIKLQEEGVKVFPDPHMLKVIQDKGLQKQFYAKHNLPTSDFSLHADADAIRAAVKEGSVSIPFVQKSRTAGYDGRGVFVVKTEADLANLLEGPSLVETKVVIEKEIAVIVCRNEDGEVRAFPVVEMEFNPTANLVEFLSCPANVSDQVAQTATDLAISVITAMNLKGILAVEMFLDQSGNVLINEVAPRPHNSGHHSIESVVTSQYQQHLRAVLNFPLGSTELKIPAIMLNILGAVGHQGPVRYEGLKECMAVEGLKLHIYGKRETRPFRKMGHATVIDQSLESAREKAKFVQRTLRVVS
jgi:5-(carboxyamino)imidazole ribonucleotide synthase